MSKRATQFHDSPWQGVFYITGGGSGFLAELLSTPGASRTVQEVVVPYAADSLTQLLGTIPEQACSRATARALALKGWLRAVELASPAPMSVACTASLATDRQKRSNDRAHLALQTEWLSACLNLDLWGSREQQESILIDSLWQFCAQVLELTAEKSSLGIDCVRAETRWHELLVGTRSTTVIGEHDGRLLLSGSFNPLHDGHRAMMEIAETTTGRPGAYELTVFNPDKPGLDYGTINERLAQFDRPLWLTRLPTFIEKARAFPKAYFAVGIDTLTRIADPKYYGSTRGRTRMIEELEALGTQFVVFGRTRNGKFKGLGNTRLPKRLAALGLEIDEAAFRMDVSSTQMRARV